MTGSRFLRARTPALLLLAALAGALVPPAAARIVYSSPEPGARWVKPATNVIVRFDAPVAGEPPALGVVGERSGAHAGRARVSDDGRTLVFAPDAPFAPGERVSVAVAGGAGAPDPRAAFAFTIAAVTPPPGSGADPLGFGRPRASADGARPARPAAAAGYPVGFPTFTVTMQGAPEPGSLCLGSFDWSGAHPPFSELLDTTMTAYYYRPGWGMDFKRQPNGLFTWYDYDAAVFYAMNDHYAIVDTFATGNGYTTDVHELRLLPDGHALLMAYDPEVVDMSALVPGGQPDAIVTGLVVQELDTQKNVVFQWRSWDHFAVTDATHEDLTASSIDAVHGNAIEVDADGNLLLSSRHLDEITKIDRTTGDILWRWGGLHNQFTFTGDTLPFSHQHAIRRIANGHYTLFDNGVYHVPQYSRACEYALDTLTWTADLVWSYRHVPDVFGLVMGYVQRLDDGATVIGWGSGQTAVTEVAADGSLVFDLAMPAGVYSYRAFLAQFDPPAAVAPERAGPGVSLAVAGPEPFTGSTVLLARAPADARFALYDLAGRKVRGALAATPAGEGTFRVRVDLAGRAPGVYLCRVSSAAGTASRRVVHLM